MEYNGSRFFGSQIQASTKETVMGKLGVALSSVGVFAPPLASGRTDTGVHALCQPITFDVPLFWESELAKLKAHLNVKLAPYIKIKKITPVKDDFHPRFHATKRVYRYALKVGEQEPFFGDFVMFVKSLDMTRVKEAIKIFEGEHDFGLFKKNGSEEKSGIRQIYQTSIYLHKELYIFRFEANSFLRSQIRLMMGALLDVSDGKITKEQLKEQLDGRARYTARIAPPNGLYLSKVYY